VKQLAKYVDGFVIVVPKDKSEEYQKMAEGGKEMWMRHGALEYWRHKTTRIYRARKSTTKRNRMVLIYSF